MQYLILYNLNCFFFKNCLCGKIRNNLLLDWKLTLYYNFYIKIDLQTMICGKPFFLIWLARGSSTLKFLWYIFFKKIWILIAKNVSANQFISCKILSSLRKVDLQYDFSTGCTGLWYIMHVMCFRKQFVHGDLHCAIGHDLSRLQYSLPYL